MSLNLYEVCPETGYVIEPEDLPILYTCRTCGRSFDVYPDEYFEEHPEECDPCVDAWTWFDLLHPEGAEPVRSSEPRRFEWS